MRPHPKPKGDPYAAICDNGLCCTLPRLFHAAVAERRCGNAACATSPQMQTISGTPLGERIGGHVGG